MTPDIKSTLNAIHVDSTRYNPPALSRSGYWVSLSYRVRRLRKYGTYPKLALPLLAIVDLTISLIKRCISTTSLPSCISIGEGLALPHPEGVIISDKATIGKGVKIFQQVTLGEWHGRAPIVGDHCELYAGAKLIGQLSLGEYTRVGANAVVTKDSPPNVTILAAQATVLPNDTN